MMNERGRTGKDNGSGGLAVLARREDGAAIPIPAPPVPRPEAPDSSVSMKEADHPTPVDVYADLDPCVREALADPATEDVIVDADGTVRVVARGRARIAGRMERAAVRRFCLRQRVAWRTGRQRRLARRLIFTRRGRSSGVRGRAFG